jgi:hypothetical protein
MMDLACNQGRATRSPSLLRLYSRLRMETVLKANDGIQTAFDESPQKSSMTRCQKAASPENNHRLPPPAARKTENLPLNPRPLDREFGVSLALGHSPTKNGFGSVPVHKFRFALFDQLLALSENIPVPGGRLDQRLILRQVGPECLHRNELFAPRHLIQWKFDRHKAKLASGNPMASRACAEQ